MRYIKTYESIKNEPQQFDWCVCDEDMIGKKYSNKIGRILTVVPALRDRNIRYLIQFKDRSSTWFSRENIIFFSKRKMDVQFYLNKEVNKYNL